MTSADASVPFTAPLPGPTWAVSSVDSFCEHPAGSPALLPKSSPSSGQPHTSSGTAKAPLSCSGVPVELHSTHASSLPSHEDSTKYLNFSASEEEASSVAQLRYQVSDGGCRAWAAARSREGAGRGVAVAGFALAALCAGEQPGTEGPAGQHPLLGACGAEPGGHVDRAGDLPPPGTQGLCVAPPLGPLPGFPVSLPISEVPAKTPAPVSS